MITNFSGKLQRKSKVTTQPLYILIFLFSITSCSVSKQIDKSAKHLLLQDSVVSTGHMGISLYDPAADSYLYNYNATKYFTPASNTKLFTLYAGMKYLGDSLVGLRYTEQKTSYGTILEIIPAGDPTFLHRSFSKQPAFDLIKQYKKVVIDKIQEPVPLGSGWSWNDYEETYMAPRNAFPMYGNEVKISWVNKDSVFIYPRFFNKSSEKIGSFDTGFGLIKNFNDNHLIINAGSEKVREVAFGSDIFTGINLLKDTIGAIEISYSNDALFNNKLNTKIIHSQPSDSLFKPMMHNSDNFFAEQTLLMASNEKLGVMNEEAIIDTLLKTDLKDIPQKPEWMDGSGLSRYNLFTPQDFIYILNKMKNEFGLERMKVILPTGGEGTIKNYYKADSGFIYVKTGTLSGQVALSGYLITKKNKLLLFSLLANNVSGSATNVRRAFERFLTTIRKKY